jgi:helicase
MKIEYLTRYCLPEQLVRRWAADGIRMLLPIQESSVTRFGILEGKSVVICGPGTSGKTFCGELGALSRVSSRGRAIFLEPLKAIAEEKFRAFGARYSPLGIKTVLSTRDHTANDRDIFLKKFDIAILIYEKFNALTAGDISLIKNASCFVIDEFQMISDPRRGIELELAVMKIRRFNPEAQLVILMGSGSAPEQVSEWLGIPALNESHRPVELRLGVLCRGRFHFKEFNRKAEGDEQWIRQAEGCECGQLSAQGLGAIEHLVGQGEQVLVFTRSRNIAMMLATELASLLNLGAAESALAALAESPPSVQNEGLAGCLRHGVAFHHADLDEYQRELVEAGFRKGEIRVLASTTTLATGVNLPTRNVFIETMKYTGETDGVVPLSGIDFHQAAGRAGRYGVPITGPSGQRDYGRAIMTADTPFEEEILWDKYIYSQSEDPAPGLGSDDITELVMLAIACGAASDPDEVVRTCKLTYAGYRGAFVATNDRPGSASFDALINGALVGLEKAGLIKIKSWGKIEPTPTGRAAASTGLGVRSTVEIIERILTGEARTIFDWLTVAVGLAEWRNEGGKYRLETRSPHHLTARLFEAVGEEAINSSQILCRLIQNGSDPVMRNKLAALIFALEWTGGRPTHELERFFGRGAGGLKRDSSTLAWIITSIARLMRATSSIPADKMPDGLERFAERLRIGVSETRLPLARALAIDREFIARLCDTGIDSVECLMAAESGVLSALLPGSVYNRVVNWREHCAKSQPDIQNTSAADSDRVIFTGKCDKLKCEIVIDGRSVWFQPRLYAYMQKLWAAHVNGSPWVPKEALDISPYQAKYISKLKKRLKDAGVTLEIASNGRGGYAIKM